MSAVVREKIKGSGEWWLFINHRGRRGSKKIGSNKTTAQIAADIINIRLILREFGLDLRSRNKNKPISLKLEDVIQLKSRLAGTAKSVIHSEIPLWALEIVEHQALWGRLAVPDGRDKELALETGNQRCPGDESQISLQAWPAHRKGEESPVYTGDEILEAAARLVEEYGTLKEYDRVQTALYKAASLIARAEAVKSSPPARPKPETNVKPEIFTEKTQEIFSDREPHQPSQQETGSKENFQSTEAETQLRQQALPAQSPEASVIVNPKRERILYEQTRKRKEYKETLRQRYSPRMGYGPAHGVRQRRP